MSQWFGQTPPMNTKELFLQAVGILAPGDRGIHAAARRIAEDTLSIAPGGMALDFVVRMQSRSQSMSRARAVCRERSGRRHPRKSTKSPVLPIRPVADLEPLLTLEEAIRVQSAEYWLKLGEPAEALNELDRLPPSARQLRRVWRVWLAAVDTARAQGQQAAATE